MGVEIVWRSFSRQRRDLERQGQIRIGIECRFLFIFVFLSESARKEEKKIKRGKLQLCLLSLVMVSIRLLSHLLLSTIYQHHANALGLIVCNDAEMDKHEGLFLSKANLIKELRREGAEKMREACSRKLRSLNMEVGDSKGRFDQEKMNS